MLDHFSGWICSLGLFWAIRSASEGWGLGTDRTKYGEAEEELPGLVWNPLVDICRVPTPNVQLGVAPLVRPTQSRFSPFGLPFRTPPRPGSPSEKDGSPNWSLQETVAFHRGPPRHFNEEVPALPAESAEPEIAAEAQRTQSAKAEWLMEHLPPGLMSCGDLSQASIGVLFWLVEK